jgi:hypothetical protein
MTTPTWSSRSIFYVDYAADIEPIRKEFDRRVRNSEEWDETVEPTVEVTAVTERTMEVRVLCSAKNPITAWVLHCRPREEMLEFLREREGGRYLPRDRIALEGDWRPREDSAESRGEENADAEGREKSRGRGGKPPGRSRGKESGGPVRETFPEEA